MTMVKITMVKMATVKMAMVKMAMVKMAMVKMAIFLFLRRASVSVEGPLMHRLCAPIAVERAEVQRSWLLKQATGDPSPR